MNCYKDFAHIYDKLINSDINYHDWSSKIIGICEEFAIEKESYLDLACGTGNMTCEIGGKFKSIWAVDLSYEMLTEAEKKLRDKKIDAKLVCQNICEINLNRKFDLITCVLDSTNYILDEKELRKYFTGIYNHLKDNGIFIFDINSYYKLSEILGDNIFNYDDDDVVYIWENSFQQEIVNMYITFFMKDGQLYRRFDEEHRERAYEEFYIEEIMKQCNLKVLKKMDNYEGDIVKSNTERITYVVSKN